MAWGKLGSTTLGSEGTSLGVTSLTDTKFIQVISHIFSGASGTATTNMHLNDVATGNAYASRYSANGGTDAAETSQNKLVYGSNTGASDNVLLVGYLLNIATEEKLFMCRTCDVTATGAGQAPPRLEQVGKWADTTNTVDEIDEDSTGDMGISSNLSALGSDLTPAAAIPAIDNVQDNSLFIEPSTARRYWFDEGLAPTFEDDFDYATQSAADAVWVPNTTNIDVNVSTDVLDINNVGTLTTNISCVCDLGTISDTKWVLRYKVNWSTLSVGERYAQTFVGLSDKNGTVAWDGSQDSISVLYNRWGLFKQQNSVAASMQDWLLGSDMTDMSVSTDYYVETIRDGTSVSYTAYSDSAYSVPVSGISGTVTLNGNPTGLQYFVIRNDTTSGTGTTAGIIDDFEFYNGVTSATPATWTGNIDLTGLKAYYKFDEASGDIINHATSIGSSDSITTSDLTVNGMTYVASGTSPFGYEGSFDGSNDDVAPDSTSTSDWGFINKTGAVFTFIFWYNKNSAFSAIQDMFGMTNYNAGDSGIFLRWNTDRTARIALGKNGTDFIDYTTTMTTPNDSNWHMIMVQYDDSSGTLKISIDNNTPESSTGHNLTATTNAENVFNMGWNSVGTWANIKLAEVSIWNRILTTSEITSLYNSGRGKIVY